MIHLNAQFEQKGRESTEGTLAIGIILHRSSGGAHGVTIDVIIIVKDGGVDEGHHPSWGDSDIGVVRWCKGWCWFGQFIQSRLQRLIECVEVRLTLLQDAELLAQFVAFLPLRFDDVNSRGDVGRTLSTHTHTPREEEARRRIKKMIHYTWPTIPFPFYSSSSSTPFEGIQFPFSSRSSRLYQLSFSTAYKVCEASASSVAAID